MPNLQTNCCLKQDFRKVAPHTGGESLIHGTKHRKENQLQSLELHVYYSGEYIFDIKKSNGNKPNSKL